MEHQASLLRDIEDFLAVSGMGESYFGRKAARNTELVKRLRDGGRVWPETENDVRNFIANNSPSAPSSEGSQPGDSLPDNKGLGGSGENQLPEIHTSEAAE